MCKNYHMDTCLQLYSQTLTKSSTWSSAVGTAAVVAGYPLLLLQQFQLRLVVVGSAVVVTCAVAAVLLLLMLSFCSCCCVSEGVCGLSVLSMELSVRHHSVTSMTEYYRNNTNNPVGERLRYNTRCRCWTVVKNTV